MSYSSKNWPTPHGLSRPSTAFSVVLTVLLFSVVGNYLEAILPKIPEAWQACNLTFGADRSLSFWTSVGLTAHDSVISKSWGFIFSPFQISAGLACCWAFYRKLPYWFLWPLAAYIAVFLLFTIYAFYFSQITLDDVTASGSLVALGAIISMLCALIAKNFWSRV